MQYEVNDAFSDDHIIESVVGQGDPKSSGAYNLAASPLNHFLAHSENVPRFEVGNIQVEPIFFADDFMNLLKGDKFDEIINMLKKIEEFRRVSGLKSSHPFLGSSSSFISLIASGVQSPCAGKMFCIIWA